MPFLSSIATTSAALASVNQGLSLARSVPTVVNDTYGAVQGVASTVTGNLTATQQAAANAFRQGEIKAGAQNTNSSDVREVQDPYGDTSAVASGSGTDMRVRLRAQDGAALQVYGPLDTKGDSNVLGIMHETNGLLFPYTPQIEWAQQVEYNTVSLTHSNQDFQTYKNTPSTNISLSGEFTVQNYREAQYMIAVIHFLRVVSKMYFGKTNNSDLIGMPPPVLIFSGYGNFMFNDLPVIVKNHAFSLPKDIDYIDFKIAGGTVRLPSMLTISMSLTVQQTPKKLREEFNLDDFRTGTLMTKNKGWI